MSRVYVYALLNQRARSIRAGERRLGIVECCQSPRGNIYAAVERREDLRELSESSLKEQHDIVAMLARQFDAILPARFGALIEQPALLRIVQLRRQILQDALARVRGHEQMTVRVFGVESMASGGEVPPITGTDYLERRRAAHHSPLPAVVERIRTHVKSITALESIEGGSPNVRAVMHHLIPRGRSADYVGLVQEAGSGTAGTDRITVSGPFAPFAFAPDIWS